MVEQVEQQDLTGGEVGEMLSGIAKVTTYDTLIQEQSIVDVLSRTPKIALLFPVQSDSSGHWLGIFARPNKKIIEHFDPYGLGPNAEMKYTSNPEVHQLPLSTLYQKAEAQGWKINVNRYRLQQMSSGVNTCGRHVICRLRLSYLTMDQYAHLMLHQPIVPDHIVTLLTLLALNQDQHDYAQISKVVAGGALGDLNENGKRLRFHDKGQASGITQPSESMSTGTPKVQGGYMSAGRQIPTTTSVPPASNQAVTMTNTNTLPTTTPPAQSTVTPPTVIPAPAAAAPKTNVIAPPSGPAGPPKFDPPYDDPQNMNEILSDVLYVLEQDDAASKVDYGGESPLIQFLGVMSEQDISKAAPSGILARLQMDRDIQWNMQDYQLEYGTGNQPPWDAYLTCAGQNVTSKEGIDAKTGRAPYLTFLKQASSPGGEVLKGTNPSVGKGEGNECPYTIGQFFVNWLVEYHSEELLDDAYNVFKSRYYDALSQMTPYQIWNPKFDSSNIESLAGFINWHGEYVLDPRMHALADAIQLVRDEVPKPGSMDYAQIENLQEQTREGATQEGVNQAQVQLDEKQGDLDEAQSEEAKAQAAEDEEGGEQESGDSGSDILSSVLSFGLESLF